MECRLRNYLVSKAEDIVENKGPVCSRAEIFEDVPPLKPIPGNQQA